MIERVNKVHPEIDTAFAVVTEWKPKVLLNRKVEELLHWRPNLKRSRGVAYGTLCRPHKRRGINERFARSTRRAVTSGVERVLQWNAGHDIETNRTVSATQPVGISDERHKGLATLPSSNTRKSPSSKHRVNNAGCIGQEPPALAEWKIVKCRCREVMLDIKRGDCTVQTARKTK